MTQTKSRTVLITGCATRIGKHIALGLAEDGWNVGVHYNESESQATDLVQNLKKMGAKRTAVKFDLIFCAAASLRMERSLHPARTCKSAESVLST